MVVDATDPVTWEVERLADWLEAVANGDPLRNDGWPVHEGVSFLEPNLRFTLVDDELAAVTVRIVFDQESRPPWDPSRFGFTDSPDAAIDLQLTAEDLRQAASDLRKQLQRFPLRVGR